MIDSNCRRSVEFPIITLAFACTAIMAALPATSQDVIASLSGIARVVDGDGIAFGDVQVRLQGIAAPEMNEPKGRTSYLSLKTLAEGKLVQCDLDGTTANRRPVGVCYVDGIEIGKAQVQSGMARDCPRYSKGRYQEDEQNARNRGMDLSAVYSLPGYC